MSMEADGPSSSGSHSGFGLRLRQRRLEDPLYRLAQVNHGGHRPARTRDAGPLEVPLEKLASERARRLRVEDHLGTVAMDVAPDRPDKATRIDVPVVLNEGD